MVETHLFQHLGMLVIATWWTSKWLINRPASRWRFLMASLSGAIMWVYVAFTALGSSALTDTGNTVLVQSEALAYIGTFMAFISVVGMLLGLFMWAEEETEAASEGAPRESLSNVGGD